MSNNVQTPRSMSTAKKAGLVILIVFGVIIGLVVILVVASWISNRSQLNSLSQEAPAYDSEEAALPSAPTMAAPGIGEVALKEVETAAPEGRDEEIDLTEQKVIKTANLTLIVDKVVDAAEELKRIAEDKGGFVQDSRFKKTTTGVQSATVTIKVPVDQFGHTISEIKEIAKVVEVENISGQDVTEKYVDLQSRLKNYQAEEAQYLEIMKKAVKVEDILLVSKELADVRGRIETVQGQLRFLENLTDMSTITATLKEEAEVSIPTEAWRPLAIVKKAFTTLVRGLERLVDILIWVFIVIVPFVVIVGILIWIVVKVISFIIRKTRKE